MLLLAIAGVILAFVAGLASVMKSGEAYKFALASARTNPSVIAALGTPIKDGFFVSGKSETSGGSGTEDVSVALTGPKGKGTLYVVATKAANRWTYSTMEVEVPNRKERIDLRSKGSEPQLTAPTPAASPAQEKRTAVVPASPEARPKSRPTAATPIPKVQETANTPNEAESSGDTSPSGLGGVINTSPSPR